MSIMSLITRLQWTSSLPLFGQAMTLQTANLGAADIIVSKIVQKEEHRQKHSINLIASENFMSQAVREALACVNQNKSAEGYPGARYHSSCENIDTIELLCQRRALEAFELNEKEWGVNVQPMSGSNANLYVYSALLDRQDKLMGLDLAHGGHLSHGYQKNGKNISMISKYFQTIPYYLDPDTATIDYDALERSAAMYRPKLIIAGTSAYSRLIDYARIRRIADSVGAYVMSDMSHIAGLVAGGVVPAPFPFSDIVTSSTAKTLRGPRGGIIFFRRGLRRYSSKTRQDERYTLEDQINASVFPGHQSSPHNNTTVALAVALHQAKSQDFKEYQQNVLLNAKAFAKYLGLLGQKIVSGGTDNHLILIDLKPRGIDGARVEYVLEQIGISSNRNVLYGDITPRIPSGLRIGTPAMTTRGLKPQDFAKVAEFLGRAIEIAILSNEKSRQAAVTSKEENLKSFKFYKKFVEENMSDLGLASMKEEVEAWVRTVTTDIK